MAKKCDRGKSCGASCVERSKYCSVNLGPKVSQQLKQAATKVGVVALYEKVRANGAPGHRAKFDRIRKELGQELGHQIRKPEHVQELKKRLQKEGLLPASRAKGSVKSKTPADKDKETSPEEWGFLSSKDYDSKLEGEKLTRLGSKGYEGWKESESPGALPVGQGSYGKVTANPDGTFVKRGIITEAEARILAKVGGKDLGPGLIAADLNGRVKTDGDDIDSDLREVEHMGLRHGRIAMTRVPGQVLDDLASGPNDRIAGIPAADVYWRAMANLHRLGIAHGDPHPGNLMVGDKTGKGRWVDFGLSQESPKAALAEALGSFASESVLERGNYKRHLPDEASGQISPGNWQTREWWVAGTWEVDNVSNRDRAKELKDKLPVLARVNSNRAKVEKALRDKFGLTEDEIAAVYAHGIRSPLETFSQGPWSRISEQDAQSLVELLYKGI